MSRVDARLREMQFLAKLDREGKIEVTGKYDRSPERQMIASIIIDGYVNDDFEVFGAMAKKDWPHIFQARVHLFGQALGELLAGESSKLRISHKGRVRLSELEQQLQTGRDRDDTGGRFGRDAVHRNTANSSG